MSVDLYPHQKEAISKLKNGSILMGEVGSGKTLTALSFYFKKYSYMNLYVITTPKKRDSTDWEQESNMVGIENITVDSWNNIKKYSDIKNSFFIFDESKISGYRTWSKILIKISKNNRFILLSATPGDTWMDYLTIFIANGFYKNKTDFIKKHVEYDPFKKYPSIKRYRNVDILNRLRNNICVPMKKEKSTNRIVSYIKTRYDLEKYESVRKYRVNPYTLGPISSGSEYINVLRRLCSLAILYNSNVRE